MSVAKSELAIPRETSLSAEMALFMFACLCCGLPVWLPEFPPMVDLPQHAAQVALLINLRDPTFAFAEYFRVNLFTPYLFGYSMIAALAYPFGIVVACKAVVSLALAAFPLATRFFLRETGADPYWAWLSIPALYGFAYQWGFLNFLVAAPLGLVFLGLVCRQGLRPTWQSSLIMAIAMNLLFFSHALIFAFFVSIAALYWLCSVKSIRELGMRSWPVLTVMPMAIVWVAISRAHPMSVATVTFWDLGLNNSIDPYYVSTATWSNPVYPGWGRISGFIPRLLGLRPDPVSFMSGVFLFLIPVLAGGRVAKSKRRLIPPGVCALVLLFVPSFVFGTGFVFQRFTLFALPFYLGALDFPKRTIGGYQKNLRYLVPVIAFAWIGMVAHHARLIDREAGSFGEILGMMEPGGRALSIVLARDDSVSIAPTFISYPAWYSAIKRGITDPSAAGFIQMPVAFLPGKIPSARVMEFDWNPDRFDWNKHNGGEYDYFVIRAKADPGGLLFRDAPCGINKVAQVGLWYLYHYDKGCRD
ncbi:MAG: hypothetical protein ACXWUF_16785 [Methylomagnum sp.]